MADTCMIASLSKLLNWLDRYINIYIDIKYKCIWIVFILVMGTVYSYNSVLTATKFKQLSKVFKV